MIDRVNAATVVSLLEVVAFKDLLAAHISTNGPTDFRWPSTFLRARLRGAILNDAELSGANLRYAELDRARMQSATLASADLTGAVLDHADLSGAVLDHADLRNSDMTGAILCGASLTGTRVEGAKYDAQTRWPSTFDPRIRGAVSDTFVDRADATSSC